MAQDGTVNVNLKITADDAGADKAEKGLERVGQAGKKVAAAANAGGNSFGKLGQGIEKVSSTVGKLNAVITGFGVVGIVMNVVNVFKALHDWINKDTKAAQELRKEMATKAAAEQIERVAEAYKKVAEAIKEAARERQRGNELLAEELRISREAEDAKLDLAEQRELEGVDETSETAEEEKGRISARYAAIRGERTASRHKEDVAFEIQRQRDQAEAATKAADEIEATFENDENAIRRKRIEARTQEALSKERNEKDGTWYNRNKRTEEGDAVRAQQKEKAESARKEAETLQKELDRKKKEVEELRRAAQTARKRGDLLWTSYDTAETRQQTTAIQAKRVTGQADRAYAVKEAEIAAAEAQRAKDSAFIAAAPSRRAEIQSKIDAANQRLGTAQESAMNERRDAWQAQQNLDLFNQQNAGRRGGSITRQRRELTENVQEEQRQAEAAEAEFQNVRSTVGAMLAELKRQMAQFEAELKNAQSRNNVRADQTGAAE